MFALQLLKVIRYLLPLHVNKPHQIFFISNQDTSDCSLSIHNHDHSLEDSLSNIASLIFYVELNSYLL